jgi:hypothetical protein
MDTVRVVHIDNMIIGAVEKSFKPEHCVWFEDIVHSRLFVNDRMLAPPPKQMSPFHF